MIFHARGDKRDLRPDQWNCLGHHVRAHQGAVGIVMLEERDQGGADAHDLVRGDIHEIDWSRRSRT